jgi:hypothetical protein
MAGNMTDNDKEDIIIDNSDAIIDCACRYVALAKEKQTNVKTVVYVDNDGNDAVAYVYDFSLYTWKSTDTFDKLAGDYLGDAALGTLVAYFNGISVESEIESGTKIKIPVLTENASNQNNRIYAAPEKQDNYGTDIKIDADGNFAAKNGDYDTVSGSDNLAQGMANRLTTASRQRIRLTAYGIRSTIGDTMAVQSYLMSSIGQTVAQDPRIRAVDELTFAGKGDALSVEVTYSDINGETGKYTGEI